MTELYNQWIWLGVPVMTAAAVALGLTIRSLIATVGKAKLCSVPLLERREVEFAEPGRGILNEEGPRFSSRFAGLAYVLAGQDGTTVEGRLVLFRARTSGFSRASVSVRQYEIPRPGRYILRVEGLGEPRAGDSEHAIVFSRPHMLRSVVHIVGLVLSAGAFITSLVFFLLRLLS